MDTAADLICNFLQYLADLDILLGRLPSTPQACFGFEFFGRLELALAEDRERG